MKPKKCPECGKKYIHFEFHWLTCEKNPDKERDYMNWYEDYSYEYMPAKDNGMRGITIRLPNSKNGIYFYHIESSNDSRISDILNLLVCSLDELNRKKMMMDNLEKWLDENCDLGGDVPYGKLSDYLASIRDGIIQ